MISSALYRLFCYSIVVTIATGTKLWIPSTNLNDKRNWNILDIPKNCDDVTFAVVSGLSLLWSFRDLLISGLKLPTSGSIIFENNVTIQFKDKGKCPGMRDVVYKRDEWKGWLDPDNWKSDSDGMWKPHADRIPCFGEDVKFPSGNNFAVQLPNIMVPVGKIHLEDEEYDGDDWADFLNTDRGKSQFRSDKVSQVAWLHNDGCSGKKKCTCSDSAYVFRDRAYKSVPSALLNQAVCLYARKTCKRIQCYSPVVPEGHCCGVCGAVIKIQDHSEDDDLLNRIREKVKKKKVESGGSAEYYVGRTLDYNIQIAIISETADHADDALALAGLVKDDLAAENLGNLVSAKFSGTSYAGNFFNGTAGIIFGTLFIVLLFFASLYLVYIVLPGKNIIVGEHPFRFARFKNALHEAGSEEKLEIGTEEALPCNDSQGFQNPTFSNDNAFPSSSKTEPEEGSSNETETRTETGGQEYDNPTYHELEKTKEFNFFEVKNEEDNEKEEQKFSEIEL